MTAQPTSIPAPDSPGASPPRATASINPQVERNISALMERRQREEKQATLQDRVANRITCFTGSMTFVYLHLVLFGFWIVANLGWVPFVPRWDPSLVVLAMAASVEAIFLSTFVLISQNRMAEAESKRAELHLQISLLNEHETTRLIALVDALGKALDVKTGMEQEVRELEKDIAAEEVLDRIEADGERGNGR